MAIQIMYCRLRWWFSKFLVHDPHHEIHFMSCKSTHCIHIHKTRGFTKQYLFLLHAVHLAIFLLYYFSISSHNAGCSPHLFITH